MIRSRYLGVLVLLGLWLVPLAARADDLTPVPQPTAPVIVEPTSPPVLADTPIVNPSPPPASEGTPVSVTQERTNPVVKVDQSSMQSATPPPVSQSTDTVGTGARGQPSSTQGYSQSRSATPPPLAGSPPQQQYSPSSVSSVQTSDTSANPDAGVLQNVYEPASAAAPSQLACSGKKHPQAAPVLVAPYAGWAEIISFVDHDSPDYAIDGKIVIANGLTVNASDGQASDLFPSYWSPSLRQFVNYDGHNGYDFDLNYQPVLAAAAGTVSFAGWNSSNPFVGYGQMILIRHRDGYVTLYGHLSKLEVNSGDKVRAGQEIGVSGTTGHSSGPHLHFSVFHDCNVTDPYGWTGRGPDPLFGFDGETARYLWLPGHDPLVLNPPPGWPTFPLGLHFPPSPDQSSVGNRRVPSVDRLLLLSLPERVTGQSSSSGVALARTEAGVAQEADLLVPDLDALRKRGLIDSYQFIPAAGAVWVRGIASAAVLEALPGVASLAGVRVRDLEEAQSGLAHSVLTQIGKQQPPSLWPAGFHSAFHAWRPIVSVLNGHALMAGFTLPGQRVVITLHRHGTAPGAVSTLADPQTGGFVAMIHDSAGNPVVAIAGDTVEASSGGKITVVEVPRFSLHARSESVSGRDEPLSTISVTTLGQSPAPDRNTLLESSQSGAILMHPRRRMTAGTMVVASVVDNAGNQESATACVPGLQVTEGSSLIRGWAVGTAPTLQLYRAGKRLFSAHLRPGSEGLFDIRLRSGGKPLALQAGDSVRIGSRWHNRLVTVPRLEVHVRTGSRKGSVVAPPGADVRLDIGGASEVTQSLRVRPDASTTRSVLLPSRVQAGDRATVRLSSSSGDTVTATVIAPLRHGSPRVRRPTSSTRITRPPIHAASQPTCASGYRGSSLNACPTRKRGTP